VSAETPPRKDDATEPRPHEARPEAPAAPPVTTGETVTREDPVPADVATAMPPAGRPPDAVEVLEPGDPDDDEGQAADAGTLAQGIVIIADFVRTLPRKPGVYRMVDAKGDVLYVGKARSLRSRVASYAQAPRLSTRLMRMVAATRSMEFVVTGSEAEALLLENNFIKQYRPRYNVLLRDDKSFPYIVIRRDHPWPQLAKHRGARRAGDEYFGPFASAGAVNRTLYAMQRAFPLRSCSDSVFVNRSRPCLQYQIRRCTAPCVGYIDAEDYGVLVGEVRDFLAGRNRQVQEQLLARMEAASTALEFEKAAIYRDRVRALAHIQSHQSISLETIAEADAFAAHVEGGQTCVQVFFVRAGQNLGNRAYFPAHARDLPLAEVLAAFIGQFYQNRPPPAEILVSHALAEAELLQEALSLAGRKVEIRAPQRGERRELVDHAALNAREAMARRLAESSTQRRLLEGVARVFGLEAPPERIEVYDNSHIQGSEPVGGMIVAGPMGFLKTAYRKFNIRTARAPGAGRDGDASGVSVEPVPGAEPQGVGAPAPEPTLPAREAISAGDDYGMMREVLTRRFARALKEDPGRSEGHWPDLVLIDGGPGQLTQAQTVLAELGIGDVPVVAIAKGPDRDAGRERFFMPDRAPFSLEPRDPVLYFLQRLRDEAHRFAIGAHRQRRSGRIEKSLLDEVPGIGPGRKKALLHHFGSARAVAAATLEDLRAVPGLSHTMAKKIHDHFRGG
jgi:excinuclease ABC subunit C